jgi:hypothetical protein
MVAAESDGRARAFFAVLGDVAAALATGGFAATGAADTVGAVDAAGAAGLTAAGADAGTAVETGFAAGLSAGMAAAAIVLGAVLVAERLGRGEEGVCSVGMFETSMQKER